jgi:hypothetical protein
MDNTDVWRLVYELADFNSRAMMRSACKTFHAFKTPVDANICAVHDVISQIPNKRRDNDHSCVAKLDVTDNKHLLLVQNKQRARDDCATFSCTTLLRHL